MWLLHRDVQCSLDFYQIVNKRLNPDNCYPISNGMDIVKFKNKDLQMSSKCIYQCCLDLKCFCCCCFCLESHFQNPRARHNSRAGAHKC